MCLFKAIRHLRERERKKRLQFQIYFIESKKLEINQT